MSRKLHALVLGLTVAAAAVPGVAQAREDDDIFPGDPASTAVVFADDGSVTSSSIHYGSRAFVDRLVKAGASGSLLHDEGSDGTYYGLSRSGYSSPTTKRYFMYRKGLTKAQALKLLSERTFRTAEGRLRTERGWAVDIATGVTKKVSVDTAKRLSLDPRGGAPNTEYVFQVFERP